MGLTIVFTRIPNFPHELRVRDSGPSPGPFLEEGVGDLVVDMLLL